MTRLTEALANLGLDAVIELDGRWARIEGEHCVVYVVEVTSATGFYTWCDAPGLRTAELFRDPIAAIQAGLRRAKLVHEGAIDGKQQASLSEGAPPEDGGVTGDSHNTARREL